MSRLKVWSTIILTEESAGLLILWRIVRIISAVSVWNIRPLRHLSAAEREEKREKFRGICRSKLRFFFLLSIFTRIRKILIVNISDEISARSILYETREGEKRDLIYQTNAFSIVQLVRREKKNSFLLVENRWPSSEFTIQFTWIFTGWYIR